MTQADRYALAREHYEERAAILEFCGGYRREYAESIAREEVSAWLKAHPESGEGND
jgi:hypothetical protein